MFYSANNYCNSSWQLDLSKAYVYSGGLFGGEGGGTAAVSFTVPCSTFYRLDGETWIFDGLLGIQDVPSFCLASVP